LVPPVGNKTKQKEYSAMNKKLTAISAAILAVGFAATAPAAGHGPAPVPGFGPPPGPGFAPPPRPGFFPPPPPPNIFYGAVIEAEWGSLHGNHPAYRPFVFGDFRFSSGGRFVGNFFSTNFVEHYGLAAVPGLYTAFVYYSSPYPGTQIEFQVVGLPPIVTPPLVPSTDPRFNPNPWVFKYVAAPIPVWLPPGPFAFRVRNVTFPNPFNRGDTRFDYDRIVFGPLALPLPDGHWPCYEKDKCKSTPEEPVTQ
jgi:hypothetical protein